MKDYIQYMYGLFKVGMWSVIEKDTGQMIGRVGFGLGDYDNTKGLDFGFVIKKEKWHQGYAYEAALAALAYGKSMMEMKDVIAFVQVGNAESEALLNKLDFKRNNTIHSNHETIYKYRRVL